MLFYFFSPGVTSGTVPFANAFWRPTTRGHPLIATTVEKRWRLWPDHHSTGHHLGTLRRNHSAVRGNLMNYLARFYHAFSWKPQLYDARKRRRKTYLVMTVESTKITKAGHAVSLRTDIAQPGFSLIAVNATPDNFHCELLLLLHTFALRFRRPLRHDAKSTRPEIIVANIQPPSAGMLSSTGLCRVVMQL